MKIQDIVLQLYNELPKYTDRFTNSVNILSATSSGTVATIETDVDHNLSSGDTTTIIDVQSTILISSMTRTGTTINCTTDENHDLTQGYQQNVEIIGANEAEFNGTFELLTVPNRRSFTLKTTDSGATIATGSPTLLDGSIATYNGIQQITSVPTTTSFTYDLEYPTNNYGIVNNATAVVGYRITGATSIARALEAYTKNDQDDYWAFVVLGNSFANKDRSNRSDAIATYAGKSTEWKQQLIQGFSIFVVAPSVNSVTGSPQRDVMEDLVSPFFKSIIGTKFDSYLNMGTYYQTVFDQHGFIEYNTSYYVHEYRFQTVADITFEDTVGEDFNVAFRDIDFELKTDLMSDDTEPLIGSVDLDDEPL